MCTAWSGEWSITTLEVLLGLAILMSCAENTMTSLTGKETLSNPFFLSGTLTPSLGNGPLFCLRLEVLMARPVVRILCVAKESFRSCWKMRRLERRMWYSWWNLSWTNSMPRRRCDVERSWASRLTPILAARRSGAKLRRSRGVWNCIISLSYCNERS